MTPVGNKPNHHPWQCKDSYCWRCRGPPSLLAMGDTETSVTLTRYESVRLWSFR
jgi:hypothetical protein